MRIPDWLHGARLASAYARGFIFRAFWNIFGSDANIGRGLRCYRWPRLAYAGSTLRIGRDVSFGSVTLIGGSRGHITIGDDCSINDLSTIVATYGVTIGNGVMIGELVSIRDSEHSIERTDIPMRLQGVSGSPVQIGDDVWIGRGAYIQPGVSIGCGAVVGAHAVVTTDVPPYSVVAGIPARILRMRIDGNIPPVAG